MGVLAEHLVIAREKFELFLTDFHDPVKHGGTELFIFLLKMLMDNSVDLS